MGEPLGEVGVSTDEGFVDLSIPLSRVKRGLFGGHKVEARGSLDGGLVAITIEFGSKWKPQASPDPKQTFFTGSATLGPATPEGGALVAALDRLYATNLGASAMPTPVAVDVIALQGDPRQMHEAPVRMKLFFGSDSDDESRYGELFVVVFPEQRRLMLNEKDQEYRTPVVRALGSLDG